MFDEGGSRVMLRKILVGAPARKILSVLPWLVLSGALFGQGNSGNGNGKNPPPPPPGTPQGDWNYSLGPSASSRVAPNMFPAKYNFNINQAPSCTEDFVVFAENVTGL